MDLTATPDSDSACATLATKKIAEEKTTKKKEWRCSQPGVDPGQSAPSKPGK